MAAPDVNPPQLFAPEEHAPASGVYRVIHARHRGEHLVSVLKGDEFPFCRKCRDKVRFVMETAAKYATDDLDLAGPDLRLLK